MKVVLTLEWEEPDDNKKMLEVANVLENMAAAKLAILTTKGAKTVRSFYERQPSLELDV